MDADYWDSLLSEAPPPRRGRRESRNLPEPPPEHATRPREELLPEPLPPPDAPPAPAASAASSGASGKRRKRREPEPETHTFLCLLCPEGQRPRRELEPFQEHLAAEHPELLQDGKLPHRKETLAYLDGAGWWEQKHLLISTLTGAKFGLYHARGPR